ncbi:MAG TPA: hypothetical protein PKH81_00880, partial [Treponemataceae bacterium]|nr:hypothetical protein [Treponemataceae bacterium]
MAEDLENTQKPKVILNKQKKPDPASQEKEGVAPAPDQGEKKKVVVIKKKSASKDGPQSGSNDTGETPEHTHVKRTVHVVPVHKDKGEAQTDIPVAKQGDSEQKQKPTSIELSPPRPNVKVGNLADHSRSQPRQGGYQGRSGGYQGQRDGFSGAQAREGARDPSA